jgi:hypothetical protein
MKGFGHFLDPCQFGEGIGLRCQPGTHFLLLLGGKLSQGVSGEIGGIG